MLRGLWKLTWIEIKIFMREPLGAFGTIGFPVLVFIVVGRIVGGRVPASSLSANNFIRVGLPVLASLLITISAVLSLVTIISIYREGGILKRLRATPLRPQTILTAHVIVKLILTAATLSLLVSRANGTTRPGFTRRCSRLRLRCSLALGASCRSAFSLPAWCQPHALRSRSAPSSCIQ